MKKFSFIARVPDSPGALHKAAEIVSRYSGNINRIQFDRRIDPYTVFFELTTNGEHYKKITEELSAIGYLQTSLKPLSFLKLYAHLPHRPGALFDFLQYTTSCRANIAYIDFDDKGKHPGRLTVSLNLDDSAAVDRLLNQLKSRYRLEIIEYDTTGQHLDDTVFYLRFAQEIRALVGESEDEFIMQLLGDINHIVQEHINLGQDPHKAFDSVLVTGKTLNATKDHHFYADIQSIRLDPETMLHCIQPPCGGNVFLIDAKDECVMVDTGYGIYFPEIFSLICQLIAGGEKKISRILITHADADHCGAGGFYQAKAYMHPGTLDIIRVSNRGYGSRNESSILEEVYTTLINLFSKFNPPSDIFVYPTDALRTRGIFPVISSFRLGNNEFEVLESLGGHIHGQLYLYSAGLGVLFCADTVINFNHITPERAQYNSLAHIIVTSVNVDSEIAKKERKALLTLAADTNGDFFGGRSTCLVCGGHGPVSVPEANTLEPYGEIRTYKKSETTGTNS